MNAPVFIHHNARFRGPRESRKLNNVSLALSTDIRALTARLEALEGKLDSHMQSLSVSRTAARSLIDLIDYTAQKGEEIHG